MKTLLFLIVQFLFLSSEIYAYSTFDLKGKAIIRPKEGKPYRLKSGQELSNEEILILGKDSSVSILVSDSSYLNLGADSVLKLTKQNGVLTIHLFRGQLRAFHSEKSKPIMLVTPVKDLVAKGKVTFLAEVFEQEEVPRLEVIMLRGSLYADKKRIRSGKRYFASWADDEISDITPDLENRLVANEKSFITNKNMGRNFNFEVELEWKTKAPIIHEPKREIASVEEIEEMEFEVVEETGPIIVHEAIYDQISSSASKVMSKVSWFSTHKVNDLDYRETALSLAIERIATKAFFSTKKKLERGLYNRAQEFTDRLITEDLIEMDGNDIKDSLWVLSAQYVDKSFESSANLHDEVYWGIKKEIRQKIFLDITERAREWSYQRAENNAKISYQRLIKEHQLNAPEGIDDLIKKVARQVSTDFSNQVAATVSEEFSTFQVNQAMGRAFAIVSPVVREKLKKMYQARMYTEVKTLLSQGRARVIASQKEEEFDRKKIQYQNQNFKSRSRRFIRNSKN